MNWFEQLTGFREESPEQVRSMLAISGNTVTSKANGKTYQFGKLSTPSLDELRTKTSSLPSFEGLLQIEEVIGDVQHFHTDPENEGAFFQAASQFNLLEMVGPEVPPEAGIGIYENDHTQGPACAIAAGAGTIFRNYFVEVDGQKGQSAQRQIDCLADVGQLLGNHNNQLWVMKNGYALLSENGLKKIDLKIESMDAGQKDLLRQQLRIGLQWNTQVTLSNCQHLVTQAYCSALPVGYSGLAKEFSGWKNFASLILEAAYEASLHAALLNYQHTQNPRVFLTLLGGGVFGNKKEWILSAIQRALDLFRGWPLDIKIVSYSQSDPAVQQLIHHF